MLTLVCLGVFVIVLTAASLYGHRVYVRPSRVYEQFAESPTYDSPIDNGLLIQITQWVHRVGQVVPFQGERASHIKGQLLAAGFRSDNAPFVVSGLRMLLLAIAIMGGLLMASGRFRYFEILALALFVYRLPEFGLKFLVSNRREKLSHALPDALDLIVVCAEAGLGLDQALRNTTREIRPLHPALADELSLTSHQMTAGVRRSEALKNLASRTSEPEIRKFVGVLVQADRFGTSLGESLRTHAEYLRTRRTQLAEERAGKVGVKLVFPIFFFILPSLLLIAAGPAIIAIAKTLLPALEGMGN